MTESKTITELDEELNPKIIRHIVMSGGIIYGLSFYGALKRLHEQRVWKHENIKTIYATSAGTLIGVVIALNIDWDVLDTYLIHRPWEQVFKLSMHSFLNAYSNCGILSIDTIEETLRPLFLSKDISPTISLQEFYYRFDIEIHFMTVQLDNFELVDVSYKTHPYWTVVEAVYASSCAPIFFKPFMKKGKLYTDGGIISNYPLQQCMENVEPDEGVLGICVNNINIGDISNADLNSGIGENLYEYLQHIVKNLCRRANKTLLRSKPTIEVIVPTTIVPIHDLYSFANSVDIRKRLIEHGGECCGCDK